MSESCFTSEIYALYAIGSLDGPELGEFDSHIRRGCELCRNELVEARDLWSAYALTAEPVAPRPELKQRILAAARASAPLAMPARHAVPRRTYGWLQMAAAIAILGIALAVVWNLRRSQPSRLRPDGLPVRIEELTPPSAAIHRPDEKQGLAHPSIAENTPPPAAQAERENRALRARIEELDRTLAAQQAQLAQSSSELQQTLARMQSESAGAAQALQQAQARAAQLEQQLTAADAERKLATDREARIRQLEGDNDNFRRVIDDQQRRIQQNTGLVAFFASPNLRFYRYEGTRNGPLAKAHVVAQEGNRLLFYAFHLPQLPAGRTYQLWLIRGQSPAIVSGGVFQADKDGRAVVEFANPALLKDVRQFAVTDEPAGGSPGPTGRQFFRAAT